MKDILFASDLDNTLIFSYKHKCDTDQCVEYLDGKEQGFFTRRSLDLLALVREKTLFIPVTTRSVEQYRRIAWPAACTPRYAAAANGGILLSGGEIDPEWRAETERLIAPWQSELVETESRLPEVPVPKRCRIVDGVYLFAACDNEEDAKAVGRFFAGSTTLETAVSGRKVYFFPPPVNKGMAVERLKARFMPGKTICAGDSVIDVPMLHAADVAILPSAEMLQADGKAALRVYKGGERFPDFVLKSVLGESR